MTPAAVGRPVASGEGGRLRVVHCVGFYFPDSTGGTEVYVRDLVSALSQHSIDGTIIAASTLKLRNQSNHHQTLF